MAVFMPINLPWESKSGPPEFPGLIAASVWMTFVIGLPVGLRTSRPRPEMTPCVSVWSRPKGLPTANTDAPTLRLDDVPTCAEHRGPNGLKLEKETTLMEVRWTRNGTPRSDGDLPQLFLRNVFHGKDRDVLVRVDAP